MLLYLWLAAPVRYQKGGGRTPPECRHAKLKGAGEVLIPTRQAGSVARWWQSSCPTATRRVTDDTHDARSQGIRTCNVWMVRAPCVKVQDTCQVSHVHCLLPLLPFFGRFNKRIYFSIHPPRSVRAFPRLVASCMHMYDETFTPTNHTPVMGPAVIPGIIRLVLGISYNLHHQHDRFTILVTTRINCRNPQNTKTHHAYSSVPPKYRSASYFTVVFYHSLF